MTSSGKLVSIFLPPRYRDGLIFIAREFFIVFNFSLIFRMLEKKKESDLKFSFVFVKEFKMKLEETFFVCRATHF